MNPTFEHSQALLLEVIGAASCGAFVKDDQNRYVAANLPLAKGLGIADPLGLVGKGCQDFYPTDIAKRCQEEEREIMRSGVPIVDKPVTISTAGTTHRLLVTKRPLFGGSREVVGVVGFVKEATGTDVERSTVAEEMQREYPELLDAAFDMIMMLEADGRVVYLNRNAEQTWDIRLADAVGQKASEILRCALPHELSKALRGVRKNDTWFGDLHFTRSDGEIGLIRSRWTSLRDETGDLRSILCVASDVTEERTAQMQLFRAQRLMGLGTLAGGVAHDLNNVLAPLLLGLDQLRNSPLDGEQEKLVEMMKSSVQRGADIVCTLLTFARGSNGDRSEVLLGALVQDVGNVTKATFPISIDIRRKIANDIRPVAGNPTEIYQVLMNLCLNARDAMPHGGTLTISVQNVHLGETHRELHVDARPIAYVLLSVEDSGSGIPPRILERIFDPFYTTKREQKGTGLGLSVSHSIVKGHGGFITVYSEVGKGSIFKVYLPATHPASTRHSEGTPTALPRGNGELVFVVDDEPALRELVQHSLESHGYRTVTAEDGTTALARFMEYQRDIRAILIDMAMPHLDGASTVRAIRKLDRNVRIIVMSGLPSNGDADKLTQLGVQAFLAKPYSLDALLKVLREIL